MIHEIAGMLSTFEPESLALATTLLGNPSVRFARSVTLAKMLSKVGFVKAAMSWFQDERWRMTPEIVRGFLEGDFLEDMNLEIIGRITREAKRTFGHDLIWHRSFAPVAAMIQAAVERCKSPRYEQANIKLIDAIPQSQRGFQITETLACHGFLHVVLKWIPEMSAAACDELCSSSDQIELVRAASAQVNRYHEEQRKVWQGLELELHCCTVEKQELEQELRSIAKGNGKGDDCYGYKGKCAGKFGGKCAGKPGWKDPQPANETSSPGINRRWPPPDHW